MKNLIIAIIITSFFTSCSMTDHKVEKGIVISIIESELSHGDQIFRLIDVKGIETGLTVTGRWGVQFNVGDTVIIKTN